MGRIYKDINEEEYNKIREKRTRIINELNDLNTKEIIGIFEQGGDVEVLTNKLDKCSNELHYNYDELEKYFPLIGRFSGEDSPVWKYICLHLFALHKLKDTFKYSTQEDILSVHESTTLKTTIDKFTGIGICCNLLKKIPTSRTSNLSNLITKNNNLNEEIAKYNRLMVVLLNILNVVECEQLFATIFHYLVRILAAFYQLLHCPLKKPSSSNATTNINSGGDFVMTEEQYKKFMEDKSMLQEEFNKLRKMIPITYFVTETMKLNKNDIPNWMKKALSHELDRIILQPKGVYTITEVLLGMYTDYTYYDRSKMWKALNIMIKIIFKFYGTKEFNTNILPQILKINKESREMKIANTFENIYILCAKYSFDKNPSLCENVFMADLKKLISNFALNKYINKQEISSDLSQMIRLSYCLFVLKDSDLTVPILPFNLIEDQMHVFLHIFSFIKNEKLNDEMIRLKNDLKELLLKYFKTSNNFNQSLDRLFLGMNCKDDELLKFTLEINGSNVFYKTFDTVNVSSSFSNITTSSESIYDLFKDNKKLLVKLFVYLLNCLTDTEKYCFSVESKRDLLNLEDSFVFDVNLERKITVFNFLSKISEDKTIQKQILEEPQEIVTYFDLFLNKVLNKNVHKSKSKESENEEYMTMFTVVMIIHSLVMESSKEELKQYEKLLPNLKKVLLETSSMELYGLCNEIVNNLTNGGGKEQKKKHKVDEAIEFICDPELPMRGHGLLCLTKLLEEKDVETMNRKQYILNILQNNIKNEDSYIYLNAIKGLAALGDVFPETVLKTLCDEYSEFQRNDSELRMKVGEVLLLVTKKLGEMAQKYKAILLNTFLTGAKDFDHLIRASSLSNLGEVCRVVNYRLGTIITEILVCVHEVVSTDKAIEPRRAAVSVLRLLLSGLEAQMISFLKDDILPIYRTLRQIYKNDEDDVMRLQAQLALEELNANMEKIILTPPTLNFDKKPIFLK